MAFANAFTAAANITMLSLSLPAIKRETLANKAKQWQRIDEYSLMLLSGGHINTLLHSANMEFVASYEDIAVQKQYDRYAGGVSKNPVERDWEDDVMLMQMGHYANQERGNIKAVENMGFGMSKILMSNGLHGKSLPFRSMPRHTDTLSSHIKTATQVDVISMVKVREAPNRKYADNNPGASWMRTGRAFT